MRRAVTGRTIRMTLVALLAATVFWPVERGSASARVTEVAGGVSRLLGSAARPDRQIADFDWIDASRGWAPVGTPCCLSLYGTSDGGASWASLATTSARSRGVIGCASFQGACVDRVRFVTPLISIARGRPRIEHR